MATGTITGLQREVRRATLSLLKTSLALTAIVPSARIYSQAVPDNVVWPFIRLGASQSLPLRASCVAGATVSFAVHAFAKTTATETAEDYASRIGAQIETALDSARADFTGGTIKIRLSEMQLMMDADEADAFHYYAIVNARVIA